MLPKQTDKPKLSNREEEIVKNVAECLSLPEMATKMNISYRTAQTHREKARQKLKKILGREKVGDAEMTHYAIAQGWVKVKFRNKEKES